MSYMIDAATKEEWAARAFTAEAQRDELYEALAAILEADEQSEVDNALEMSVNALANASGDK